jgi:hypothetical protein
MIMRILNSLVDICAFPPVHYIVSQGARRRTIMAELPEAPDEKEQNETLIVPPPNFRDRLLAAARARKTGDIRQSVEIPNPLVKSDEASSTATDCAPKNEARPKTGPLPKVKIEITSDSADDRTN